MARAYKPGVSNPKRDYVRSTTNGPEDIIQNAIIALLRSKGWFVHITHGNVYSHGLPDLYVAKRTCGSRWIEVKNPLAYHFTPAQLVTFHEMSAQGIGIWVLVAATEQEFNKLFKPPNWVMYLPIMKG